MSDASSTAHTRSRADLAGVALAALYALPTLAYPFGRDQSIFFYIGRAWADGRLPYRDAFDIKPPGIYALYALCSMVLGARPWAIRVAEILGVILLAWIAARVARRDGPPTPGVFGATALLASGWYFTCFDYWDSGQVELWESLIALAGYAVATTHPDWKRAAVGSGLLGGAALLFKFPIAVVLPVAGLLVAARALRAPADRPSQAVGRATLALALHGLSAAFVIALTMLYFALRGGWSALVELIGYTAYYVQHKPTATDTGRAWFWFFWRDHARGWMALILAWWVVGASMAWRGRAWSSLRGLGLAALLFSLAVLSGVSQNKFWSYHWVVTTAFVVLGAAYGAAEVARRWSRATVPLAGLCVCVGLASSPTWITNPAVTYLGYTRSFWRYVRGADGRLAFLRQFVGPFGYSYANEEVVGDLIGDAARPGDQLHVRGFEPAIYAASRLASPSRFASEAPLIDPSLAYHRTAWQAEHDRAIWRARPRFVVTFSGATLDMANLTAHGYRRTGSFANFIWFERGAP